MSEKDVTRFGPSIEEIQQMQKRSAGQPITPPKNKGLIDPNKTPGAIQGVGAAYVANQNVAGNKLSKETVDGLHAMHKEREDAEKHRQEESKKAQEAAEEAIIKEKTEDAAEWGMPNADMFRMMMSDNPFLEPGVREAIEADLPPISLVEFMLGRGKQVVKILPDLFVEFQTVKASEDLLIKQLLRDDAHQLDVYFDDKKTTLNLAAGIVHINGVYWPALEDPEANGKTTENTILKKFNQLQELPIQLVAMLAINYTWFDYRIRKLITPEILKNG